MRFQTEIAKARLDLGQVITRTAEQAQSILGADGAAVEMEQGEEMVYQAATGIAAKQLGMRLAKVGSLSGLCVATQQMLTCEDAEADDRVDQAACRAVGLRSMILVPLRHEGLPVGALKVMSRRPRAFRAEDLQTLDLISEVIAAAMAHATEHDLQVEEARALYRRATQDSLTGLGNRALFHDRLHQGLAQARRTGHRVGVVLLDMDGLKALNDAHGHRAGDAALRALGQRLRQVVRETDLAARLGGDEFAVLLAPLADREAAERVALKFADQVKGPLAFEGKSLPVMASVGVAVFPEDGADPESLLQSADEAMYAFKRARGAQR
ncbi:MAG TPA: sensor domain-containing diguanylate cyclase [Holophagaceae bacterium]|nr:sensor domain-containing diguanylate cyclase [Holophagaceae bacterium]